MEYRRVRRASVRRHRGKAVPATVIVGITLIAGIYVFGISKLGTWLAQSVVAPTVSAMLPLEQTQDSSTRIQTIASTPEPVFQREMVLPNLDCYAIQIGIFSDIDNAKAQSEQLRNLGAAGYLVEDGEHVRVLAAGYPEVSAMQQVRGQLETESIETHAFEIHTDGVRFHASGTEVQLNTLDTVLIQAGDLAGSIYEASLQFDKKAMSTDEGSDALKHLQAICSGCLASANALANSDLVNAIQPMQDYFSYISEEIGKIVTDSSTSTVDFSASLKHLYLDCVYAYAKLTESIGEL